MANNITTDYKIIIIDTKNVFYNGDNTIFDFHIKLHESLRDVYKIKILYDAVSFVTAKLNNKTVINDNPENLDTIYINLNDYDRVRSYIIDQNKNSTNYIRCFDSIMIDKNKVKINENISDTTMFNDFNTNEGDFYLNPVESQFNRINITLRDKNNNLITKSLVDRFVMKLCVYYNTKKISIF
jgi:hypothetical protein